MANYYQEAIDAAKRGDKAAAEAALNKREEKMNSSSYKGTGGGTSMQAARDNINSILSSSSKGGSSGSKNNKPQGSTSVGGDNWGSRDQSLDGKKVKDGEYTITYDVNGYAVKRVKDGGASANSYRPTTHANDSAYHKEAYEAAQRGDWDAVGNAINKIGMSGGTAADGTFDMGAANDYFKELADRFGYNAKDYYNKRYDEVHGAGSSDVWDATGGAIKGYDELVGLVGGQAAQGGVSVPGGGGIGLGAGSSSAEDYLRDLWEQKIAAELAALRSTYEQNMADIKAQDDLIAQKYNGQRNQLAAMNDLQRMQMNELGLMQGLNTGTTGQMALANSAAFQSGLATLGGQEAQSLADNALNLVKLSVQYRNDAARAEAAGQASLAEALYEEAQRQEELALAAQQRAQQQANWEKQFSYQQQMDQRDLVNNMLKIGVTPDAALLESAGIDPGFLQLYRQVTTSRKGQPARHKGYDNGGLTSDQVRKLQEKLGVTADGLWGKNSKEAADGLTADEAWAKYGMGPVMDVKPLDYQTVLQNSASGKYGKAYNIVLSNVQAQLARGASRETLAGIVDAALTSGDLSIDGARSILDALNMRP